MRAYDYVRRLRRQAAIADYISRCDDALQAEIKRRNGKCPDQLIVPFASPHSHARAAIPHRACEFLTQ